MKRCLFLLCLSFVCNSVLINGANDHIKVGDSLQQTNYLAAYISSWPSIIQDFYRSAKPGAIALNRADTETHISNQKVIHFTQELRWTRLNDKEYVILKKNTGDATIVYEDFAKTFMVEGLAIQKIGCFLCPPIAEAMREVSLQYTNICSLQEICDTIVAQCPLLKILNLSHNKLQGVFSLKHSCLRQCIVTHNNFSSLGCIELPQATCVDLRHNYNSLCVTERAAVLKFLGILLIDRTHDDDSETLEEVTSD